MVILTVHFIMFIFQEGAGLETLCSAVRELIHSCGDELGWCFTEDQVPFVFAIFDFDFGDASKDGASLKLFHLNFPQRC